MINDEDIIDCLSEVDKKELLELANESSDKDSLNHQEFIEVTKKWRSQ